MWPFGKSTEKRLEEALKDQEKTAALGLNVDIKKKTAVISGQVPNEQYKNLITTIAKGINGVEDVDLSNVTVDASKAVTEDAKDMPKVTPAATAQDPAPVEDSSAHAKAALEKIKGEASLANNPLDVLQKGTTVVLRGAVDSQEEFDKAKALAGSVEGRHKCRLERVANQPARLATQRDRRRGRRRVHGRVGRYPVPHRAELLRRRGQNLVHENCRRERPRRREQNSGRAKAQDSGHDQRSRGAVGVAKTRRTTTFI